MSPLVSSLLQVVTVLPAGGCLHLTEITPGELRHWTGSTGLLGEVTERDSSVVSLIIVMSLCHCVTVSLYGLCCIGVTEAV